jgi:hypothetical protein
MSVRVPRSERVASVKNLIALLSEAKASPDQFAADEAFLRALGSQGALAALSVPDRQVSPMSLNHQKAIAESLGSGFSALDTLRKETKAAIAKSLKRTRRPSRDIEKLNDEIRRLEKELQLTRQDLWITQRAYDTRCRQASNYPTTGAMAELCKKEQRETDASLSLTRSRWHSNVTNLEDTRNGS